MNKQEVWFLETQKEEKEYQKLERHKDIWKPENNGSEKEKNDHLLGSETP